MGARSLGRSYRSLTVVVVCLPLTCCLADYSKVNDRTTLGGATAGDRNAIGGTLPGGGATAGNRSAIGGTLPGGGAANAASGSPSGGTLPGGGAANAASGSPSGGSLPGGRAANAGSGSPSGGSQPGGGAATADGGRLSGGEGPGGGTATAGGGTGFTGNGTGGAVFGGTPSGRAGTGSGGGTAGAANPADSGGLTGSGSASAAGSGAVAGTAGAGAGAAIGGSAGCPANGSKEWTCIGEVMPSVDPTWGDTVSYVLYVYLGTSFSSVGDLLVTASDPTTGMSYLGHADNHYSNGIVVDAPWGFMGRLSFKDIKPETPLLDTWMEVVRPAATMRGLTTINFPEVVLPTIHMLTRDGLASMANEVAGQSTLPSCGHLLFSAMNCLGNRAGGVRFEVVDAANSAANAGCIPSYHYFDERWLLNESLKQTTPDVGLAFVLNVRPSEPGNPVRIRATRACDGKTITEFPLYAVHAGSVTWSQAEP